MPGRAAVSFNFGGESDAAGTGDGAVTAATGRPGCAAMVSASATVATQAAMSQRTCRAAAKPLFVALSFDGGDGISSAAAPSRAMSDGTFDNGTAAKTGRKWSIGDANSRVTASLAAGVVTATLDVCTAICAARHSALNDSPRVVTSTDFKASALGSSGHPSAARRAATLCRRNVGCTVIEAMTALMNSAE